MSNAAILDTGSAFCSLVNKQLLAGVHVSNNVIQMQTNVGSRASDKKGSMPGREIDPWHDEQSTANAFGFSQPMKENGIACDAAKENCINVHADDGVIKFKNKDGLCVCVNSQSSARTHAKRNKRRMTSNRRRILS